MRKLNVAVTGYFRTGSSAVVDLLKEYSCVDVVPYEHASYEHNVFYHRGGLFDLCTLLLYGNSAYRSDYVINNFINEMKRLNDYNYVWYGSYKKLFGKEFMKIVYSFTEEISKHQDDRTIEHVLKTRFSFLKLCAQFALKIFKKRKITNFGVWYVYDKNDSFVAMPTKEELFSAAQRFTNSYFELFNKYGDKRIRIYDHIIWPSQIDEYKECFDDSFKTIVVQRDPRDLYIMEKYLPTGNKSHFPINPNEFASELRRTFVKDINNPNCLIVNFEDLVYKYQETVKEIETFLGLDSLEHISPKSMFNPDVSIENTQVFRTNEEWEKESKALDLLIGDLYYNFPFKRRPERKKMFADGGIGKISI